MPGSATRLVLDLLRAVAASTRPRRRSAPSTRTVPPGDAATPRRRATAPPAGPAPSPPVGDDAYPGDFRGRVAPAYRPDLDGEPDPGEIVWTWVPYEDDHTRGKDRPVLVVGHDGPWLLCLILSSRDHDTDPSPRRGEQWLDLGAGEWDSQRRPSEVRLDRVVRIDPAAVRREGAILDRVRFDAVTTHLP